jgi:hypothetical protein
MNTRASLQHLHESAKAVLAELEGHRFDPTPYQQAFISELHTPVSASSTATSCDDLKPSMSALGRLAIDELDEQHPLNVPINELLGLFQSLVRAQRRESRAF